MNYKVSAIIPVFNGEKFIKQNIDSLLNQTRAFDEIIVVDDGSEDRTAEIAKKLPVKVIELGDNKGRSFARNFGFEKSNSEIVFFVEADAIYDKKFLEACLKHFDNEKVAGVIGKQEVWNVNENVWTKCKQAEREANFENYKPFSVWMYRRGLVEKAGGFDTALNFGEDVNLSQKIKKMGFELVYEPKALWFHMEPKSFIKILKRNWHFGIGINQLYRKTKYPKTMVADFLFFAFLIAGFVNPWLWLFVLGFLTAKIILARRQFAFISPLYWGHLKIFILIPSIVFKFARILGIFIKH